MIDRYKLLRQALDEALGTVRDKSGLSLFVWAGGWRVYVEEVGDSYYSAEMRHKGRSYTLQAPYSQGRFDWSKTALIEQSAH